jgi:mono/diheme cytochrome c family protein
VRAAVAGAFAAAALAALAAAAGDAPPTWRGSVGRLVQAHCANCHRPGDIAPMPLLTYGDAAPWAEEMATETGARRMPPWKPDPGHGLFLGENRLTDREIATFAAWAAAGAPEGAGPDPKPRAEAGEWPLGEPDAILSYGTPFTPPAEGEVYRCFPIPTDFPGDRWVRAVDILPGDRATVHYVILFIDTTGASLLADALEPGPGYTCFGGAGVPVTGSLGGWAPGFRPFSLSADTGLRLPAGATVVMQVHYRPDGLETPDATRVGLYFHEHLPEHALLIVPVGRTDFTIPAGDPAFGVEASQWIPPFAAVTVRNVAPHMHLLGRSMAVDALLPDGTERSLVRISDWDFHWQAVYSLRRPAPLPGGTTIRVRTVYDNSAANPDNPASPPVDVSYGEATSDEMGWAFLGVTLGAQGPPLRPPEVSDVAVDGRGRLMVRGRGIRRGARIEIDGEPVPDSRGTRSVVSAVGWADLAPEGVPVSVAVRNPDGHLSRPVAFTR